MAGAPPPMILMLADPGDLPAMWLQAALRHRLALPVELVTPSQLVYAPSIEQRLSSTQSHSRFRLWSGTELDLASVTGVINRITAVPLAHLERAELADRDYAAGELHAFLLGWLASLDCPVLNPPAPEWLAGAWHGEIGALHLAAQAGLRCPRGVLASDGNDACLLGEGEDEPGAVHFVLDDQLIGPVLGSGGRDALIAFAHGWGARLLQVETREEEGQLAFLRATSLPDYRVGGAALVRAIARVFGA